MIGQININLPVLTQEEYEFFVALLVDYYVQEKKKGAAAAELVLFPLSLPNIAGYSVPFDQNDPNDPLMIEKTKILLKILQDKNILSLKTSKMLKGRFSIERFRPAENFSDYIKKMTSRNSVCQNIHSRFEEHTGKASKSV